MSRAAAPVSAWKTGQEEKQRAASDQDGIAETVTRLVSTIMPSFIARDLRRKAVDSALQQMTCRAAELTLIDDGLTDTCGGFIRAYAGRLKLLQPPSKRPCPARNEGVAAGRGVRWAQAGRPIGGTDSCC